MPITDMQPAEKVWGNFGCIRINCRTLCSAPMQCKLRYCVALPAGKQRLMEVCFIKQQKTTYFWIVCTSPLWSFKP